MAVDKSPSGVMLARQLHVNGMFHVEGIRALGPDEHTHLMDASSLASAIARRTPYHALITARDRFQASFEQFVAGSTESSDAKHSRVAGAMAQLCEAVAAHRAAWATFVTENGSDGSLIADALEDWTASPAVTFAGTVVAAGDAVRILESDGQPRCVVESTTVDVGGWMRHIELSAVLLADAALGAIEAAFREAAAVILGLASEVLSGVPILMPLPQEGDASLTMNMGALDIEAVRAADTLMLSARSMAIDIRKELQQGTAEWGTAVPENALEPSETTEDEHAPETLGEVQVDLRRVVEAISTSADGLASKWARQFDEAEFLAAVEQERTLAASLVQPIQRMFERDEAAATSAGEAPPTLPGYPVLLHQAQQWLADPSNASATAVLVVLQSYLGSLGELTFARQASFGHGDDFIEFDPFRTTTLHRQGRLLADLAEARTDESEIDRIRAAIYMCHRLGLPEAQLLYGLGYLARTAPDLSDALAFARERVASFVSDGPAALDAHVVLADLIASEIERRSQAHG